MATCGGCRRRNRGAAPEVATMHDERKYRVYLAGPMSGCNEAQVHWWRNHVAEKWRHVYEFVDPSEDFLPRDCEEPWDDYEVVVRDQQAIVGCDGVLANMWKESIGTAIGVFHACVQGKPVVVVDPNRLRNRTLSHYAREVVDDLDRGVQVLGRLLDELHAIQRVEKRTGGSEPFQRAKLILAIRHACLAAGRNDMLAAAEIFPEVMARLLAKVERSVVRSRQIMDTVWEVLQECEADPLRMDEYRGIRQAWERFVSAKPAQAPQPVAPAVLRIHKTPRDIDVHSDKSHRTIWGKAVRGIGDLPEGPRRVVLEIARVAGIARLVFRRFGPGARVDHCSVELLASKSPGIIEGKLHDQGAKGRLQCFQLKLDTTDPQDVEAIRNTLLDHLHRRNLLYKSHRQWRREAGRRDVHSHPAGRVAPTFLLGESEPLASSSPASIPRGRPAPGPPRSSS
jgi:nucleoside 2-deoxyribosyltransferase